MPNSTTTYNQPEEDAEFLRCREYLYMREMGKVVPMEAIAEHFGIAHSTMYNWIARWTNNGLLAKCREKLQAVKFEGVESAETRLFDEWPAILANMATIAKSNSYRNAIEAARFLEPTVNKLKERQAKSAVPEADYVESLITGESMFDPLDIPPPALQSGE